MGSSDDEDKDDDSDLDPCSLENDGDTSYDSDGEGGFNLSAIFGGAAASNDDWVAQGQLCAKFPFSGDPGIKANTEMLMILSLILNWFLMTL